MGSGGGGGGEGRGCFRLIRGSIHGGTRTKILFEDWNPAQLVSAVLSAYFSGLDVVG